MVYVTLQKLSYFLLQSGLASHTDVKRILGTSDDKFDRLQSANIGNFPGRLLGELAKAIATDKLESIAQLCLGFNMEDLRNKRYENIRNSELFNLAILEMYAKREKSTLEVIALD